MAFTNVQYSVDIPFRLLTLNSEKTNVSFDDYAFTLNVALTETNISLSLDATRTPLGQSFTYQYDPAPFKETQLTTATMQDELGTLWKEILDGYVDEFKKIRTINVYVVFSEICRDIRLYYLSSYTDHVNYRFWYTQADIIKRIGEQSYQYNTYGDDKYNPFVDSAYPDSPLEFTADKPGDDWVDKSLEPLVITTTTGGSVVISNDVVYE